MFKNYFKTAWRNLSSSIFYSIINISGLALGLATGIMLLLWVQQEKSYDKFNKDYQNIYRLSTQFSSNGETVTWTNTPAPLAVFAQSMPGIKSIVRITSEWDQIISNGDRSKILDGFEIAYVDSSFFSIFDYKLREGNIKTALPNEHSVMLTHETAEKSFGNDGAIGKLIHYSGEHFKVTAVLENFPQNSSLQFDAL